MVKSFRQSHNMADALGKAKEEVRHIKAINRNLRSKVSVVLYV